MLGYTRSEDKPAMNDRGTLDKKPAEPQPRVMKIKLWLRVENNNKFVRGKGKARDEIESRVLGQFGMEKTTKDGYEYILSIPYTTDEELERTIYDDIYAEAENIADYRNCFTEGDMVSLEDPERSW